MAGLMLPSPTLRPVQSIPVPQTSTANHQVTQTNKQLFWSHSTHGELPFHTKNSSRAPCLPFPPFTHNFCEARIRIRLCQISGDLYTEVNHKKNPFYSISHTTLMWTPNQDAAHPVHPSLMAAPSAAGVPLPLVKCYTDKWTASDNWLHGFNPQPTPGKQKGCQDHLSWDTA